MANRFGPGATKSPLLRVQTNAELDRIKEARAEAKAEARKVASDEQANSLVKMATSTFEENKTARLESGMEEIIMQDYRQVHNEYDPDTLSDIQDQGAPEIFMGLTALKCRDGDAWLRDTMASGAGRIWQFKPSPLPDLPPSIENRIAAEVLTEVVVNASQGLPPPTSEQIFDKAQELRIAAEEMLEDEASKRAMAMQKLVDDQMKEGGWDAAFAEFIWNAVATPCGILKGPILRMKRKPTYDTDRSGRIVVRQKLVLRHEWETPSCLDIFPSKGAVSVNDGFLVERVRMNPLDLQTLRDTPGYIPEAIDATLLKHGQGGFKYWTSSDPERHEIEEKGSDAHAATKDWIEGLEMWGMAPGILLIKTGIYKDLKGEPIDPVKVYDLNCLVVDTQLIYRALNPIVMGLRPYSKSGWWPIANSFWYRSVAGLMRDVQSIANATIRSLVTNESVAAGPQITYTDVSRIPQGEDITACYPLQVRQFLNPMPGNNVAPIQFNDIPSNANELLAIYRAMSDLADEYTGIPSFAHGNDNIRGAGRTASGLSMLMSNASRGIKASIARIHKDVVQPSVYRQFLWNMQFHEDDSVKGDLEIQVMGILAAIMAEELTDRRMGFLQQTMNPVDLNLTGLSGRAELLRLVADSLEAGPRVVKPEADVEAMEQTRQVAAQQLPEEAESAA